MRRSVLNFFFVLAFFSLALIPFFAFAQDGDNKDIAGFEESALIAPNLNIPIPYVDLTAPVRGDSNITVSFLGQYISGVYTFLLSIVGVVAGVMMILGGYQYLTAGGDKSRVDKGKNRIVNALIGMVLAFGSYALLYSINPALVEFEALELTTVNTKLAQTGNPHEEDVTDAQVSSTDPRLREGQYTSSLEQARQGRLIPLDFSEFGEIDFSTYGRRDLSDITKLVVHNGGFTGEMNPRVWKDLCAEGRACVGAHYTIDRNGTIFQHVNDEGKVAHANRANSVSIGVELNITKYNGRSCNSLRSRVGADAIEEACAPTGAQYAALLSLINDVIARTNVTLDENSIIGHCEARGSTHGDPRAFDWTRIGLSNEEKQQRLESIEHVCRWYYKGDGANKTL